MRIAVDTIRCRDFCTGAPEAVEQFSVADGIYLPFITLAALSGQPSAISPQLDVSPTTAARSHDGSFRAAHEASGDDEVSHPHSLPVAALNAC